MTQPSAKTAYTASKSVAFQYVQQQVARDMAALYKAFPAQEPSTQVGLAKPAQAVATKRSRR